MIDKNRGDIVNLGSIAGYQTYSGGSIYNATKFAVRALTEAWRKDLLGKNIRVIGIHPGMVETEFSEVRLKGNKEQAKKVYQGFQPLTAADIAESIVWSLQRPSHVNIESLVIMPTAQAAVGMVAKSE
jgi:NADP-dependent 3-hydroxy acid dehydrogenase YdfG